MLALREGERERERESESESESERGMEWVLWTRKGGKREGRGQAGNYPVYGHEHLQLCDQ